jgi:hypothetical protein
MAVEDLPVLELAFPGPERDSGVAAILAGEKTALTRLLQIHEHAGEPVPRPGQRFSVLDSAGQPAAVIELTEVRVLPISMVMTTTRVPKAVATLMPPNGAEHTKTSSAARVWPNSSALRPRSATTRLW